MKTTLKMAIGALAVAALVQTSFAQVQVIVNETFSYADQAALEANWSTAGGLTLDAGAGNPAPSAAHPGATTTANIWTGSSFSLTPTDANPVRLTADIFSTGTEDQSNTVGLRTAANPLFEMGMYRFFDNNFEMDNETALSLGHGIGVRTINIGEDLPGQDWVKFDEVYSGWARWEATFTEFAVTVRVDYDITGDWDITFVESGSSSTAAFSDLRIHSPVVSAGGGFNVDNIRLEVVPEPSTIALGILGGFALLIGYMRRRR